ncbi:MAG TPA: hypothetical protein VLF67_04795 [Candidatus Saccharimonas sp.]|nr:hypothetical protein [Candidatus Saccharimonas sp.]
MLPILIGLIEAAAVAYLAYWRLVWLALAAVAVIELWREVRSWRDLHWRLLSLHAIPLLVGSSVAVIIALQPRAASQLVVTGVYGLWLGWRMIRPLAAPVGFAELLAVQAVTLEALFLAAAIWKVPRPLVMLLVWVAMYATSYRVLADRGERAARALAAAWALVAAQVAWVSMLWLVSYITPGHFAIVPQPVLVLTAVAYCFGSIYLAQKQGELGRGRFAEYLVIGFVLLWIVVTGTHWRGTL